MMGGIAGFCGFGNSFCAGEGNEGYKKILTEMQESMQKRGTGGGAAHRETHCALCCVWHPGGAPQPVVKKINGKTYAAVFDGSLYNRSELIANKNLNAAGFPTGIQTDAETALAGYALCGADITREMNGQFAFAVWNGERLFLARDHAGIKPLYFTIRQNTLVFGSEIKTLFRFPGIEPAVDSEGLSEIFALGPARTPGAAVFRNIHAVKPGQHALFSRDGFRQTQYWDVTARPHTDSHAQTVETVKQLVTDAVHKQIDGEPDICSLLSGGVDSSILTAMAAHAFAKNGKALDTYSFDFTGNDEFFKANSFQPSRDRPWVDKMSVFCQTNHRYLECGVDDMAALLHEAVEVRGLPGMADVDASLLYFCKQIGRDNPSALTGECADEIFGGYPWFHSREAFETRGFPWSAQTDGRTALLSDELLNTLDISGYASQRYEEALAGSPRLDGETAEESRRREIAYLNLKWFMAVLAERMERISQYAGLSLRAPFADYRIIDYVFNVPWEMKCKGGVVKDLLRRSADGLLPHEILYRTKSPFPKTYNPAYENLLRIRLTDVLNDSSSPLLPLVNKKKAEAFMQSPGDYGKPWFGQLMAGPQMMAYLLQVDYWLREYRVNVKL